MNVKQLFDTIRTIKGGPLTQVDVDAVDKVLTGGQPPSTVVSPAPAALPLSSAQLQVDVDLLCTAFPANTRAGLLPWVQATRDACAKWGIDTKREVASFLANINVETRGLTQLSESLNYSTDALVRLFGRHRISLEDAERYGRNARHPADQVALANILYGGEWGRKNLGNAYPGDGWKFRGYGPKQLTGRANQTAFAAAAGMDVEDVPAYIRTPQGGMDSAGWYWKANDLDAKAATPELEDDRRAVNGGLNGFADFQTSFDMIINELLRREKTQ